MSRLRVLGFTMLVASIAVTGAGCSKKQEAKTESDRGAISFSDPPPGSTTLGLCYAYDIAQMKELIGGGSNFKRLAPAAIGKKGDKVTGEACAWERKDPNGDALSLRIEVRNYGTDSAELQKQFDSLRTTTVGAQNVPKIGELAFSSASDQTTLLQVRSGKYLLTLSSRAEGKLEPIPVETMVLLGTAGLGQLP